MEVGRSIPRVDAADKVTGRAKYTDDLCPHTVLEAAVLHSTIANGWVKSMDISEAQALPGVVKVLTCFDVPDIQYPTPGHPWSVEAAHQDVSDRKLLNRRVRIYGDDIAAVVAEDLVTAHRALKLIRVEYEEYPVALEPEGAMAEGFPPSTRSTRTTCWPGWISAPPSGAGSLRPWRTCCPAPGSASSRGTMRPSRCSTATSRTRSPSPIWSQGASRWSPPPRSPTLSAG